MSDERLRILLPMEPEEDGIDALRLLEAMFPPEQVLLRRVYVYRPAELDLFVPEMYASMPQLQRMNDEAEAAAVAESNRRSDPFRAAGYEIEPLVYPGSATNEILGEAERWKAGLILVRASRQFVDDERIGTLAAALVYHSNVPVLMYRHVRPEVAISRVLIPTDLSENSRRGVEWGVGIANRLGAEAHLLYIAVPHRWQSTHRLGEEARGETERWLERARPFLSVKADAHVHSAPSVPDGVLEFAREHQSDLIVLSAQGRSAAAAALLGSNARRVIRRSKMPVFVVPASVSLAPEDVTTKLAGVTAPVKS